MKEDGSNLYRTGLHATAYYSTDSPAQYFSYLKETNTLISAPGEELFCGYGCHGYCGSYKCT